MRFAAPLPGSVYGRLALFVGLCLALLLADARILFGYTFLYAAFVGDVPVWHRAIRLLLIFYAVMAALFLFDRSDRSRDYARVLWVLSVFVAYAFYLAYSVSIETTGGPLPSAAGVARAALHGASLGALVFVCARALTEAVGAVRRQR